MEAPVVLKKISIPLILLATSLVGAWFYRPWIYNNHIYDWHIGDSFPSFFGMLVPYYMYDSFCSLYNKRLESNQAICGMLIGNLLYESIQIGLGGFDWFDIIAILLGTVVVFILDRFNIKVTRQS